MKVKYVVIAIKCHDRTNGNTYHSARIVRCSDGATLLCPMQYGYGRQYMETALLAMADAKWLPSKYRAKDERGITSYAKYESENGYPIVWNVFDGLKRECKANGEG